MSVAGGDNGIYGSGRLSDGLPSLVAAANELRSPLALIRQLSLMLDDDSVGSDDKKAMIDQISLTTERTLRLTSDLTKSAQLADGLFKMEPIDPQLLCEQIVSELRPMFMAHSRDLKLAARRHPLLLIANRDLLTRIVMNFSDNALHYADPSSPIEIQLSTLNFGQTVRLAVRDFGPALPIDTLDSLDSRLRKNAKSAIFARPRSSGLGLYIARQFADVMNGRIGIIRHRDGSTFYIDLQASSQLSLL
ncbi:HAMP domain-containing histidine kinase [Candidatus Saccharibacteria bacterium]|nr:HAMP domain-containing histidine kinase [Candidatus Saccharibacteria bacterium]